jgi:hypothetical protein
MGVGKVRQPTTAAALVLAAVLAASGSPAGAGSRAREEHLAAELAAARSRSLYLVLDPHGHALDLKVDGFLLHRFAVEQALLGTPWGAGAPAWPALVFRLVSDVPAPDRQPIPIRQPMPASGAAGAALAGGGAAGATPAGRGATGTPAAGETTRATGATGTAPPEAGTAAARADTAARAAAAAAGEIPPGMPQDSLRQVPSRYLLRFAPDLDVTVVGQGGALDGEALLWRVRRRLAEGWRVAADRLAGRRVVPRLLLVMAPDEARRLFLALRSDTRLLIAVAD